jgi:hypothetical protein
MKAKLGSIEIKEKAQEKTSPNRSAIERTTSSFRNTFNLVEIQLLGAVKAGLGSREDDLESYSGEEAVSVPDQVGDPAKYYALRVKGVSMIHENIYPGDLVIVEKVSLLEIGDGDLIVAKYLPNNYINKKLEDINLAVDAGEVIGPTLKYFSRLKRGDKKRPSYRLSWQTEAETSEFRIDTPYIENNDLGRVVAVYSPEQFRLIKEAHKG